MPMVSIINTDDAMDPTFGDIAIGFDPATVPQLRSLQDWSPGDWFDVPAAWRADLGSPAGAGGTPAANAGAGSLFNNQYGFMFMAMPMMGAANVPSGKSLGIRLLAVSSPDLRSFNYVNSQNRWDQVFDSINAQVLWNGNMWHNYFTLPAAAPPGTYTATFEVFIANEEFTPGTGWADYTAAALAAAQDLNFTPATLQYTWVVIPEPSAAALVLLAAAVALGARRGRQRRTDGS